MKARHVLTLAAAVGFVGLFAWEVQDIGASCAIGWDRAQPSSVNANLDGSFAYNLKTSVVSDFNCATQDFTLFTAYTPGTSLNISGGAVTPTTHAVTCTGSKRTINSGVLIDPSQPGKLMMSAWDGSSFECSATHRADILPRA